MAMTPRRQSEMTSETQEALAEYLRSDPVTRDSSRSCLAPQQACSIIRCTRPPGHAGQHIACATLAFHDRNYKDTHWVVARWSRSTT